MSGRGRPRKVTARLAREICDRVAGGASIIGLERDGLVHHSVVYRSAQTDPDFRAMLGHARAAQVETSADEIRSIGIQVLRDTDLDPGRARAAVDALEKAARLRLPRDTGGRQPRSLLDRSIAEPPPDAPLRLGPEELAVLTDDELEQLLVILDKLGLDTGGAPRLIGDAND
jgi:Bacteriophage Sf6, terminase small subunit-like